MYRLDWSKYLSTGRDRVSQRTKENDARNDFESDMGRAIFSSAIRRMHDKAQVMPLTSGDSMHTSDAFFGSYEHCILFRDKHLSE